MLGFLHHLFSLITSYAAPVVGLLAAFLAFQISRDLRSPSPESKASTGDLEKPLAEDSSEWMQTRALYPILITHFHNSLRTFLKIELRPWVGIALVAASFLCLFSPAGQWSAVSFAIGAGSAIVLAGFLARLTLRSLVKSSEALHFDREEDALLSAVAAGAASGFVLLACLIIPLGLSFWFLGSSSSFSVFSSYAVGVAIFGLVLRVTGGIFQASLDSGLRIVETVDGETASGDVRQPIVLAAGAAGLVRHAIGGAIDLFSSLALAVTAVFLIVDQMEPEVVSSLTSYEGKPLTLRNFEIALAGVPLGLLATGFLASLVGINIVQSRRSLGPRRALHQGSIIAAVLFSGAAAAYFFLANVRIYGFISVGAGLVGGWIVCIFAEYHSLERATNRMVDAARTGTPFHILAGLTTGLNGFLIPFLCLAAMVWIAAGWSGAYGIAVCAVALLAMISIVVVIDVLSSLSDAIRVLRRIVFAAEAAAMKRNEEEQIRWARSGRLHLADSSKVDADVIVTDAMESKETKSENEEGSSSTVTLRTEHRYREGDIERTGPLLSGLGRGIGVVAASISSLAMVVAFHEILGLHHADLLAPSALAMFLLGALLAVGTCSIAVSAVGAASTETASENRAALRRNAELFEWNGDLKELIRLAPTVDTARLVGHAASGSRTHSLPIILLAILFSPAIGLLMGAQALGVALFGVVTTGTILAIFMTNVGGALDNAKKLVESGVFLADGLGSDLHRVALIGDTIGSPLRSAAGPTMNTLMKVVAAIAVFIAPFL